MDAIASLAGRLLLALPGIGDPRFEQAVLAVCAHDDQGALALNVGRTVEGLGLHALMAQLDIDPGEAPDAPIHHGGPVESQRGFVLHSPDWRGEDTIAVADRWALTGTLDVLRALAAGTGPTRWLVALGCAGWAAGQLEEELRGHCWHAMAGDDSLLFDHAAAERWTDAFREQGIEPGLLASHGGTA